MKRSGRHVADLSTLKMADLTAELQVGPHYYKTQVLNEYINKHKTNTSMKEFMTKQWVDIMIDRILAAELIVKNEGYTSLHESIKTTLRTYLVEHNKDGTKTLVVKPFPGKEHRSREIVPLEESYQVMQKAHILTNHGTAKEMEAWLEGNKYLVHSMCCGVYRRLCMKCTPSVPSPKPAQNFEAQDTAVEKLIVQDSVGNEIIEENTSLIPGDVDDDKSSSNTNELSSKICDEESFQNVCSVDILDISNNADHYYHYLLIYQDKQTKFIQLRPLNTNTVTEIALELIKIIMDFGPPDCIVVNADNKKMFVNILERIKILACCDIALALHKSENKMIQKVAKNIINWMKVQDCQNWGTGCHVVQWNMNNVQNNDGSTPFSRIFGYKYTGFGIKSKFIAPMNDNSDQDDNMINLDSDNDEEIEGNLDQDEEHLAEESVNNKVENEAFLVTMTENVIKIEVPDPEVQSAGTTTLGLEGFQCKSDEDEQI